jgi:thiamine-phosphate pyrophosphorylase
LQLSRLNAIVDVDAAERAGWDPVDLARAFVDGGATFLQIRAKQVSSARLLDLALRIGEAARPAEAMVIVNDRADVARLAGAGVHVGQDDLSPRDVRAVVGAAAIVGLSTHTVEQMQAAVREPVSYVAIGPVFGTATKATGYDAIGLETVRAAGEVAHAAGLPLVAIGGITLARMRDVVDAGADAVAVIGDLLATGDPAGRVREYLRW